MIKIISAEHICAAPNAKFFPEEVLPGFSFLGKSNVGKSSLINSLVNRRALARTSKQPGRTQLIHFYKLLLRGKEDRTCYLVDFPGYGYAKVPQSQRKDWAKMVNSYFDKYENQAGNFLLHDSRRDVGEQEIWILDNIDNLRVVLTKVDKVGIKELSSRKKEFKDLGAEEILLTSAAKKKGIVELLQEVYDLI